jgi:hypothetical protein
LNDYKYMNRDSTKSVAQLVVLGYVVSRMHLACITRCKEYIQFIAKDSLQTLVEEQDSCRLSLHFNSYPHHEKWMLLQIRHGYVYRTVSCEGKAGSSQITCPQHSCRLTGFAAVQRTSPLKSGHLIFNKLSAWS